MAKKSRLTSELIDAIAERIRVGTYPYVAAAACGVPKSTYYRWMQRAEQKGAPKLYRELRDKISEAGAIARSNAEVRVFRDRPFEWLRYGPGRERPGEPGWTETPQTVHVETAPVEVQVTQADEAYFYKTLGETLAALDEIGALDPTTDRLKLFSPGKNGDSANDGTGEIIDVPSSEPDES